MDKNYRIPIDTFYILIAQKCGKTATPTVARKYIEALQEVMYEQLNENGDFYFHGIGSFEKTVNPYTGKYMKTTNFQSF